MLAGMFGDWITHMADKFAAPLLAEATKIDEVAMTTTTETKGEENETHTVNGLVRRDAEEIVPECRGVIPRGATAVPNAGREFIGKVKRVFVHEWFMQEVGQRIDRELQARIRRWKESGDGGFRYCDPKYST